MEEMFEYSLQLNGSKSDGVIRSTMMNLQQPFI